MKNINHFLIEAIIAAIMLLPIGSIAQTTGYSGTAANSPFWVAGGNLPGLSGNILGTATGFNSDINIITDNAMRMIINGTHAANTINGWTPVNTTGYVGIKTPKPKAKPEVADGELAVNAIGSGIMLNAPNGNNYYPITVDNTSKLIIKF